MKKLLLILALVVATAMTVRAEYTSDGFYRVHNYDTNRYIYVYDNTGSINLTGTTVDLYAIQLWLGRDRAISDPASVLYIEKHDKKYDIKTQGTGIHQMINAYLTLRADNNVPGTYWAYGSSNGMTKYLCDGTGANAKEQSWLVGEGTARRNWYVTPIDAASDNYFGITPTVDADGANWAALYADFSFSFASEGMEAYYVKSIDSKRGMAIIAKIDSEWIYNSTPVIVKCGDSYKGSNRLNLEMKKGVKPNDNLLTGVYFNYSEIASHINRVRFDKNTMRVLGTTKDGHIGLVADNIDYVPRNSVYLTVPAGSPSDFRLVSQAEYDNYVANEKPEPQQVVLDKTEVTLTIGGSDVITATVLPADATTTKVTWTTSNDKVATVDANGRINAVGVGQATITAKCDKVSATCKVTVKAIPVESITLSTSSITLLVGESDYINATVAPDNATDKSITWTTSDPQVATVSADGRVDALKAGTATITATSGSVKATCEVTVKDVEVEEITLSRNELSIMPGMQDFLYAYVKPDNAKDKTVVWTSSDPEVATVSVSGGTVTAIKPGITDVTATCGKVSATCRVTVLHNEPKSVTVTPRRSQVEIGTVFTVEATVSPSNTTRPLEWSSSDESILTVADNGDGTATVTTVGIGEAEVVASCGELTAACRVTVTHIEPKSITVSPEKTEVEVGTVFNVAATVNPDNTTRTLEWSSSDESILTVADNGDGTATVTTVGIGAATVTAKCGSLKATCRVTVTNIEPKSVTVTPEKTEVEVGTVFSVTATVNPDNTTRPLKWSSSNESILTVADNGDGTATVTTVAIGEAQVIATCGSLKASCRVTVTHIEPVTLVVAPYSAEIKVDSVLCVQAAVAPENTTRALVWTSSDQNIIKVADNGDRTATVTAVGAGAADVIATCGALKVTCHVEVSEVVGITDIEIDSAAMYDVYNLQGVMVRRAGASLDGLPAGVYIINGQKYLIK